MTMEAFISKLVSFFNKAEQLTAEHLSLVIEVLSDHFVKLDIYALCKAESYSRAVWSRRSNGLFQHRVYHVIMTYLIEFMELDSQSVALIISRVSKSTFTKQQIRCRRSNDLARLKRIEIQATKKQRLALEMGDRRNLALIAKEQALNALANVNSLLGHDNAQPKALCYENELSNIFRSWWPGGIASSQLVVRNWRADKS
jgi:hypothetical protein